MLIKVQGQFKLNPRQIGQSMMKELDACCHYRPDAHEEQHETQHQKPVPALTRGVTLVMHGMTPKLHKVFSTITKDVMYVGVLRERNFRMLSLLSQEFSKPREKPRETKGVQNIDSAITLVSTCVTWFVMRNFRKCIKAVTSNMEHSYTEE